MSKMNSKSSKGEKAKIIAFPAAEAVEEIPDIYEMDSDSLLVYRDTLAEKIEALDAKEPRNMNSEAYEKWADQHEELEDLLDEVLDLIEDRMGR